VKPVRYAGRETSVQLGDRVLYRPSLVRWRWKESRISYVPGVSKPHPEMEHGGLQWVGVSGVDWTFRGVLVEPDSGRIRRSVHVRSRTDGSGSLKPDEIPDGEW
jgi:hypothetical protein